MTYRTALAGALLFCLLFATRATAQPGDRYLDIKARVLDVLFPLDVTRKPYLLKMILRFGDSDTQLVVVVYPGGKSELVSYSLAGMNSGQLSQLISKMEAQNPDVKEQDIAAKLHVNVSRSPIDSKVLDRALHELEAIRIAPVSGNRIAVDHYSEYEFWYDTWQESSHYTITGPPSNSLQNRLVTWMIKFQAKVPKLLKDSSAAMPQGPLAYVPRFRRTVAPISPRARRTAISSPIATCSGERSTWPLAS